MLRAIVAGFGIFWTTAAQADEPAQPVTPRVQLRHDVAVDVAVTGGLAGAALAWTFIRPNAVPTTCNLCDGEPGQVNGLDDFFRRTFKRDDTGPAAAFSNVFGFGLAPLSSFGLGTLAAVVDRRIDEAALDDLLVAEATVVDLAIDQAILPFTRRERPEYHFASPEVRAAPQTGNNVSSLPSGHTSSTFAMAASAGTIASMRGYRLAPLVWIVGMLVAGSTAYFRIAADKHYFTDTLAGAGLGTLTGIGVPLLFHGPSPSGALGWLQHAHIGTADVPRGRALTLGWTF